MLREAGLLVAAAVAAAMALRLSRRRHQWHRSVGGARASGELAAAFIALLDGNLLLDLMEPNHAKRDLRRAGLRRVAELVVQAKEQS